MAGTVAGLIGSDDGGTRLVTGGVLTPVFRVVPACGATPPAPGAAAARGGAVPGPDRGAVAAPEAGPPGGTPTAVDEGEDGSPCCGVAGCFPLRPPNAGAGGA